jgi:hypothetical protein
MNYLNKNITSEKDEKLVLIETSSNIFQVKRIALEFELNNISYYIEEVHLKLGKKKVRVYRILVRAEDYKRAKTVKTFVLLTSEIDNLKLIERTKLKIKDFSF